MIWQAGLFAIVIAGAFGLLWGSFLNVVIHRLPQMEAAGLRRHGKPWHFLLLPLSNCPHCHTPIRPWHNIPIISFIFLRGRSLCCQKPISRCYPLIELSGGAIIITAALVFGIGLNFVLASIFLSALLVIAIIDMRSYYILDILTLPLLWLGLLVNIDARFALLSDAILGAAAGYIGMRCLAAAGYAVFQKTVIGYGDFKLMAAMGAWLGWQPLPVLLFMACVIGLFYALILSLARQAARSSSAAILKRQNFLKSRFHFGPALSIAGAVMLIKGNAIITAYLLLITGGGP